MHELKHTENPFFEAFCLECVDRFNDALLLTSIFFILPPLHQIEAFIPNLLFFTVSLVLMVFDVVISHTSAQRSLGVNKVLMHFYGKKVSLNKVTALLGVDII